MDQLTEHLLDYLKTSPTDLRKLAQSVDLGRSSVVGIASRAIERWERDDPQGWAAVRSWLAARDVRIVIDRG